MKKVFLDTETTGLDPIQGHRIIEIAAVAYEDTTPISPKDGGLLHLYINPERDIDSDAQKIHNLSADFLADHPVFALVADKIKDYLAGCDLFIHNADFDVGFIDAEFKRVNLPPLHELTNSITCTLQWAKKHVKDANGKRIGSYSLDNLCKEFGVDLSTRDSGHSAIVDTRLLAQVYFLMTQQQIKMTMTDTHHPTRQWEGKPILTQLATASEVSLHEQYLQQMYKDTQVQPLFSKKTNA